jgi:hypothetical protein
MVTMVHPTTPPNRSRERTRPDATERILPQISCIKAALIAVCLAASRRRMSQAVDMM